MLGYLGQDSWAGKVRVGILVGGFPENQSCAGGVLVGKGLELGEGWRFSKERSM